jgi:phosphatidate cytidylyltransferase
VDEPTPDLGPGTPSRYGRAGRNLWSAIAVGLVLGVGLTLVPLLLLPWVFAVVVALALLIGLYELEQAFAGRGIRLVRWPLAIGTPAVVLLAYFFGIEAMLAAYAATVLLALVVRLAGPTQGYVADVGASAFALSYTALMGGFVALSLDATDGAYRVLTFIVLTICSDVGGYAAGVVAGRHPIAPSISPKKSWEGLAGSFVLQAVAGVLLFVYLLDAPWWQGLVVGLVLTVTATMGDFVESALKRDLGVKDMGTLLPGHGGLMDRLDSLLPNAFTSWALFTWFLGS